MPGIPHLHDRLLSEQVRLLVRNVPALVVGTLVLATGTATLLLMNDQPATRVTGWLSLMVALCLVRWAMARAHGRTQHDAAQTVRWARILVVSSAIGGLLWGALAWLFFTPDQPYTLVLVAMVRAAILSSATQSLGPYFPAHLAFGLPCALPFALRCLLDGQAQLMTLGVLTLVFLGMTELFARRIAAAIEEALQLRFENETLVGQLSAEKERAEAASRAKTRFLATASHDLRQPIHAMGLFVPALKRMAQEGRLSATVLGDMTDRMQAALGTMGQLLNRLLDVSRLDAGAVHVVRRDIELEPLLSAVVDEVAAQAQAKGLRLRRHDGGLWVHSDPAVLHTMLSNLVSNAVRYTDQGGVLVAARPRGTGVDIQVWDTGIGISAQEISRLPEEFFQASNAHADASQSRGLGLGLAIVQRSAQLIGARLNWRSELGRGSMFSIHVSRGRPVGQAPERAPPSSVRGHVRTVLVVDENPDILAAMALLLRSWGEEPLLAASADEADRIAKSHAGRLHAALVDFHLTQGQNGLIVAERLQRTSADLAVAIVTGDTSAEVMEAVRSAGLVMMHKPVDPTMLQQFIARPL